MKRFLPFILKTLLLLGIVLLFYFIFIFIPTSKRTSQKNNLTKAYFNLVQNRTALVNLAKLDPNSPTLNEDKSQSLSMLDETIKTGLENLPKLESNVQEEYKRIFEEQKSVLSALKQKKSFEEGISLLKSDKVIRLLTDEANLILKLQSEIKKLR